jgi:TPR repeat protein
VDRGDTNAAFNLGLLYDQGWGSPRDAVLASKCYRRAANAGVVPALNNLAVLTLAAIAGLADTPRPSDENIRQALNDLREAAEHDDAFAHFNRGQLHLLGMGLARSPDQAIAHFERAVELGHTPAMRQLAQLYSQGLGCNADSAQALALLERAAALDDAAACYELGRKYVVGDGVLPDAEQALRAYQKAARLGDIAAQLSLGSMYANGQGTAQDFGLALRWYQAAAGQAPGDAPALAFVSSKPPQSVEAGPLSQAA